MQKLVVGDTWYVKYRGANAVATARIEDITVKTVVLKQSYICVRYIISDVEFIELAAKGDIK